MKHKHYDVIVAWAEGQTIQYKSGRLKQWFDWDQKDMAPVFSVEREYRIKPPPPPKRFFRVWQCETGALSVVCYPENMKELFTDSVENSKSFARWLGEEEEYE
jgi:hypothetical protein